MAIDTPSSGDIYGSGFISPDGTPYSLDDVRHGDWALMFYRWLEKKGYNISTPQGFDPDMDWSEGGPTMSANQSDAIRDELVQQGWIHVFTPDILSVWRYDFKTEEMIKRAFREGKINNEGMGAVKVVEQSTGISHSFDLSDIEESVFASRKFTVREASVDIKFLISPEGKFYSWSNVDIDHDIEIKKVSEFESMGEALAAGWTRGGNRGGNLYVSTNSGYDGILNSLKRIPKEYLQADELNMDIYNNYVSIPVIKNPILSLQRFLRNNELITTASSNKIEEPNSYQDTEGWVSRSGRFYPLDGALSHGQWVVNNYDWLTTAANAKLPPKKDLVKDVVNKGSDYVRNLLVSQGWIHVYNPTTISVKRLSSENSAVTDYILTSGNGYADNDVIEVYSLDDDEWTKKTFKQWKGEDDGFSAFSSRNVLASGGYKAWIKPDTKEVMAWRVGSAGGPHHVDRMPEDIAEDLDASDITDGNEKIEYAVSQGWIQVAIDGGYLYITAFDETDVENVINLIPTKLLMTVNDIITDVGNVQVDEGEDPLKAWKTRKGIRKRVASKFSKREASKDGFDINIEKRTIENENYREVLFTAPNVQLVVMSLKPGQEIGMETHKDGAQFIRVEKGTAKAVMNGEETKMMDGSSITVPAGVEHNVINTGDDDLKLYTIYAPPQHEDGAVFKTKEEADNMEKHSSTILSSRDAVKDTINYWDKAKNKDFSKYWRQLKKKKKKKASFSVRDAMEGNFKYSCLMIDFPEDISKKIIDWGKENIPDDSLYTDSKEFDYGRESQTHVTVCFGIGPKVKLDDIKKEIDLKPLKVTLDKISKFDTDKNFDVIKIEVNSDDLNKMNKEIRDKIGDPGNTFPDYKPHLTIAYVKKGSADDLVGSDEFDGQEVELDLYNYSHPDGEEKYTAKKEANVQLSHREAKLGDFGRNKRWKANLSIYDIIKKYETNPENYQNVSYKIFKRIMRNVDGYKFLLKEKKERLKKMAQEFCDLKDKKFKNRKEFEAAFNVLFEKLYKFADKNKIWIG